MFEGMEELLVCKECNSPRVITTVTRIPKLSWFQKKGHKEAKKIHEKLVKKNEKKGEQLQADLHKLIAEAHEDALVRGLAKITMSCPNHSKVSEKDVVPKGIEASSQLIRDHLLICEKCGSPVEVQGTSPRGDFTVLTVRCTEHGDQQRQVATFYYEAIMGAAEPALTPTPAPTPPAPTATPAPKPTPPPPAATSPSPAPTPTATTPPSPSKPTKPDAVNFCRYCGANREASDSKFCDQCGQQLR